MVKIKVKFKEEENSPERKSENRIAEIDDSLKEIYRDNKGKKMTVDRLKINRKHNLIFWFFNILIFSLIGIAIILGAYHYIFSAKGTDSSSIELKIESKDAVVAGEEVTYKITYNNKEYVALKYANLKVTYPENFIFEKSSISPTTPENNSWELGRIGANSEGELEITGKILDKEQASEIILAELSYMPDNFSSEFQKEASFNSVISGNGLDTTFDYADTALINVPMDIKINFKPSENNYLQNFVIRLEKDKNIDLQNFSVNGQKGNSPKNADQNAFSIEKNNDPEINSWQVSNLGQDGADFDITYNIKDATINSGSIKIYFTEKIGDKEYTVLEKDISLNVIKSDLNLSLTINDSASDQAVNFAEKLQYVITYTNNGNSTMKDVSIMAVLDGDFLDWTTLDDENKGKETGDTITWTKENIPALEALGPNQSGEIKFSIDTLPFTENTFNKNLGLKSYAQYSLNTESSPDTATSTDSTSNKANNLSNTINSNLNSDFSVVEQARYFNESNLPVGSGPLPPKVGETTSFKIYWTITNNLHELNNVSMETVLPAGIEWDDHNLTSVGTINYDANSRKVTWQIGRLPITVFRADAEFNISLTPGTDDQNKIIVILGGSKATADDSDNNDKIEKTTIPKTTKLEDDDIANMSSDGRVR